MTSETALALTLLTTHKTAINFRMLKHKNLTTQQPTIICFSQKNLTAAKMRKQLVKSLACLHHDKGWLL
jgi:hypothetical protein